MHAAFQSTDNPQQIRDPVKLRAREQIEASIYEIYDESSCHADDDTLIWLSPDNETTENDGGSDTKLYHLRERSFDLTPGDFYFKTHAQSFPAKIWPSRVLVSGDLQNESELTYNPFIHFKLRRGLLRLAALASILVTGTFLPGILERAQQTKANASSLAALPAKTQVDRRRTGSGQMLIIRAKSRETIEDISIRYVGHFDRNLFEEICNLNPTLKNPNYLEDGQLIRIPVGPTQFD